MTCTVSAGSFGEARYTSDSKQRIRVWKCIRGIGNSARSCNGTIMVIAAHHIKSHPERVNNAANTNQQHTAYANT